MRGPPRTPLRRPEELAKVCADAEDSAHCGRLVEEVQLKRLPNLAGAGRRRRSRVSLYPSGTATLADTEALNGGRSYSLWDYLSELNAVVLYTTDGDDVTFTVLQRATGRKTELPSGSEGLAGPHAVSSPRTSARARCVNELAVWRVTRDGIRKEWTWKPRRRHGPMRVASWKSADTHRDRLHGRRRAGAARASSAGSTRLGSRDAATNRGPTRVPMNPRSSRPG